MTNLFNYLISANANAQALRGFQGRDGMPIQHLQNEIAFLQQIEDWREARETFGIAVEMPNGVDAVTMILVCPNANGYIVFDGLIATSVFEIVLRTFQIGRQQFDRIYEDTHHGTMIRIANRQMTEIVNDFDL